MTHFLVVTFIVATRIFLIRSEEVDCGPGQVARAPGTDCKADCCPVPQGEVSPCEGCLSPCKCANLQQVYALNNTCIFARDCPPIPCGPNQDFTGCPNTFCSESCSNAQPPTASGQRCRNRFGFGPGPVVICRPACTCKIGYFRNAKNECVYYTKCPGYQTQRNCD